MNLGLIESAPVIFLQLDPVNASLSSSKVHLSFPAPQKRTCHFSVVGPIHCQSQLLKRAPVIPMTGD